MIQTQSNPPHLNLYQPPEKILQSPQPNLQLMSHAMETEELSKEFVVSIQLNNMYIRHWIGKNYLVYIKMNDKILQSF